MAQSHGRVPTRPHKTWGALPHCDPMKWGPESEGHRGAYGCPPPPAGSSPQRTQGHTKEEPRAQRNPQQQTPGTRLCQSSILSLRSTFRAGRRARRGLCAPNAPPRPRLYLKETEAENRPPLQRQRPSRPAVSLMKPGVFLHAARIW